MKFSLLSWGAWSPQSQQRSDWKNASVATESGNLATTAPKLPQVPAMQRRRLSTLTKIILDSIFQCEPPAQCRSIFASQHGEINRTVKLLSDIINHHALSPAAFSQSVHNTASGFYSIFTQNKAASIAIAAGDQTFAQAFTEAYAQLVDDPAPLLLAYADDAMPDIYMPFSQAKHAPISAAFVLALAEPKQPAIATISLSSVQPNAPELTLTDILSQLAQHKTVAGNHAGNHWSVDFD